jgi:ComF family protein
VAPKTVFPTSRDLIETPLRRAADAILNLIYPENCCLCSASMTRHQDCAVCGACWANLLDLAIAPPICPSCGLPFEALAAPQSTHLCGRCILHPPPYSGARAFGYYASELSRAIQQLKFGGRKNLVRLLAPPMAEAFTATWKPGEFDLVAPVPLHPKRRAVRGFNQAALLARHFSLLTGIPWEERVLVRVVNTPPQVGLSDSARQENVRSVFACRNKERIAGSRILLMDDVMTTGATLSSAALALRSAGARRVSCLTLARAVPNA